MTTGVRPEHRVRRWCDEAGHAARCRVCAWSVRHPAADVVRAAVARHEQAQ